MDEEEEKKRLVWVKLYEQTKDAGLTCRRCGISLRKWFRRYQAQGEAGLRSQSRRPIRSPLKKADGQTEAQRAGTTPFDFPVGIRDTQSFKVERLQTPCQTDLEEGGIPAALFPMNEYRWTQLRICTGTWQWTAVRATECSKSTKNAPPATCLIFWTG